MHGRTISRQRAQVHNRDRTSRWTDNIPGDGYIIAVNPAVLSGAGIDAGALACATCLGAGIMTICMGIFANRPLACASGLGVNAMIAGIATTVCGGDWHVAMSVIFLEASSSCCSCFVACARPSWTPSPWFCATLSRWAWACSSP